MDIERGPPKRLELGRGPPHGDRELESGDIALSSTVSEEIVAVDEAHRRVDAVLTGWFSA